MNNIEEIEFLTSDDINHPEIQHSIDALRAFDRVVQSCFGSDLSDSFKQDIHAFGEAWKETGLSVTPKIHVILVHRVEFLQGKNHGLGRYSELAIQASHQSFVKFWENYSSRDPSSPSFRKNLFNAVVALPIGKYR